MNPAKQEIAELTNPKLRKGSLKDAIEGADVFIGVSAPGVLTTEMVKTMNRDAIIFACANPTPEIFPEDAKAGGALDVRASDINDAMKLAAASAIAGLVSDEELNADYILPKAFDPRVKDAVARATAEAARASGAARI